MGKLSKGLVLCSLLGQVCNHSIVICSSTLNIVWIGTSQASASQIKIQENECITQNSSDLYIERKKQTLSPHNHNIFYISSDMSIRKFSPSFMADDILHFTLGYPIFINNNQLRPGKVLNAFAHDLVSIHKPSDVPIHSKNRSHVCFSDRCLSFPRENLIITVIHPFYTKPHDAFPSHPSPSFNIHSCIAVNQYQCYIELTPKYMKGRPIKFIYNITNHQIFSVALDPSIQFIEVIWGEDVVSRSIYRTEDSPSVYFPSIPSSYYKNTFYNTSFLKEVPQKPEPLSLQNSFWTILENAEKNIEMITEFHGDYMDMPHYGFGGYEGFLRGSGSYLKVFPTKNSLLFSLPSFGFSHLVKQALLVWGKETDTGISLNLIVYNDSHNPELSLFFPSLPFGVSYNRNILESMNLAYWQRLYVMETETYVSQEEVVRYFAIIQEFEAKEKAIKEKRMSRGIAHEEIKEDKEGVDSNTVNPNSAEQNERQTDIYELCEKVFIEKWEYPMETASLICASGPYFEKFFLWRQDKLINESTTPFSYLPELKLHYGDKRRIEDYEPKNVMEKDMLSSSVWLPLHYRILFAMGFDKLPHVIPYLEKEVNLMPILKELESMTLDSIVEKEKKDSNDHVALSIGIINKDTASPRKKVVASKKYVLFNIEEELEEKEYSYNTPNKNEESISNGHDLEEKQLDWKGDFKVPIGAVLASEILQNKDPIKDSFVNTIESIISEDGEFHYEGSHNNGNDSNQSSYSEYRYPDTINNLEAPYNSNSGLHLSQEGSKSSLSDNTPQQSSAIEKQNETNTLLNLSASLQVNSVKSNSPYYTPHISGTSLNFSSSSEYTEYLSNYSNHKDHILSPNPQNTGINNNNDRSGTEEVDTLHPQRRSAINDLTEQKLGLFSEKVDDKLFLLRKIEDEKGRPTIGVMKVDEKHDLDNVLGSLYSFDSSNQEESSMGSIQMDEKSRDINEQLNETLRNPLNVLQSEWSVDDNERDALFNELSLVSNIIEVIQE